MASVSERLERALERETPEWGIRPVPDQLKRFGKDIPREGASSPLRHTHIR